MATKTFGQPPLIPVLDTLPTLIGPAGVQIAVAGVVYVSDGTQWNGPKSAIAEVPLPLFWSNSPASTTSTSNNYINPIATAMSGVVSPLRTLGNKWSASTNFAFEAIGYVSNASNTAFIQLYDVTASSLVSGTLIQTSSTGATLLRSGSVNLTPGHSYAVAARSNNTSYTAYVTNASIVALMV